jgi:hypothetical protein
VPATRTARTYAAAAAIALAVAGCGGGAGGTKDNAVAKDNGVSKLSAADALKQVQAALKKVETVHVDGHLSASGQGIQLDLRDKAGAGTGTIKIGGGEIDVVRTGDDIYVKGDKGALAAFGASSVQASLVAGKWLHQSVSARGSFSSLADLLDSTALFSNVTTPTGELKTGTTTTVGGQNVFTLIDGSADGNGTLYIAATGDPLPVRVDQPGSSGGSLDFEYGVPVDVTAPSGAVDLSTALGG